MYYSDGPAFQHKSQEKIIKKTKSILGAPRVGQPGMDGIVKYVILPVMLEGRKVMYIGSVQHELIIGTLLYPTSQRPEH